MRSIGCTLTGATTGMLNLPSFGELHHLLLLANFRSGIGK